MEKEAIEIRKEINLLGPRGKTERIPDGIREKVYKYLQRKRKQGTSWEKIARKVGLGATTVHRLYDMYEKEPGQGEIVRVEVKTGQEIEARHLILISPTGYRLFGLDLREAAMIMRELS